jgi:hypothetical protein
MKLKNILFLLPFLGIVLLSSGCARLAPLSVCDEFEGVIDALDRDSTVSIFFVHGMGGYTEKDPYTIINNIKSQLCLEEDGDACLRIVESTDPQKVYGCLKRQDYCGADTPYKVRTYILDWRATTWKEKMALRMIDESCEMQNERVRIANDIKKATVNGGLADIALYLGEYEEEIRIPFEQAMRWVYHDAEELDKHEIILVSFSIGGFILIDTLDKMCSNQSSKATDKLGEQIGAVCEEQISSFFMLSNPVPLFAMAKMDVPDRPPFPYNDGQNCNVDAHLDTQKLFEDSCDDVWNWNWSQNTLGRFIQKKRCGLPDFQIVSFSDPNDIVSYAVKGIKTNCVNGEDKEIFVNAKVRNVKYSFFGLVNPLKAHTGYGANCSVQYMILNGNHVEGSCND